MIYETTTFTHIMQVGSVQAFALQENVPNFLTTSAHSQSMANDSEQEHCNMS